MKKYPVILLTLVASLASCGSKEVTIDYDNPQFLNKNEFEKALSLFITGNCTLEMDEAYNRKTEAEYNSAYFFTAEIDFDANMFHGILASNPEYWSTQNTSSYLAHGDLYLYAGKSYCAYKIVFDHGADTPLIDEATWENKEGQSFADMLQSGTELIPWEELKFQTNYDSYSFNQTLMAYEIPDEQIRFWSQIRAIQFASGRLSRIFSRTLNGWNKVTKVGTTKVTIPDDVKEKGDNGPATTSWSSFH